MKFKKLTKMAAVLATLAFAGFSTQQTFAAPDGVPLAKDQVLKLNTVYPDSIDPTLIYTSDQFYLVRNLFPTLVRQNFAGEYIPEAAASWTVSKDNLTYTFKLRDNLKWTDGKPVTANDFVYSWRRLVDPKTAATYAFYLQDLNVVNAGDIISGKKQLSDLGVRAVDDHTFEVKLSQPTPWFIPALGLSVLSPLRQDVIEKWGKEWTKPEHYVTSGAFKMTVNRYGDNIVLEKNPEYWDAKHVAIQKVDMKFVDNPNASYYGFLSHDFTFAGIPPSYRDKAYKELKDSLVTSRSPSVYALQVNVKKVPDVRVRQALAMLLDRDAYIRVVKVGESTSQLTPPYIKEGQFVKQQPWFGQDRKEVVAKAVQLLKDAGYTPDKPFQFKFLTGSVKDNKFFIAAKEWFEKDTGGLIQMTPDVNEGKILEQKVQDKDFEVTGWGWGADYNHISTFLNTFTCGNPQNNTNYCNLQFDALLRNAAKLDNPLYRARVYGWAAQLVQNDYVWLPYMGSALVSLKDPTLMGFNLDNAERYIQDYYFVDKANIPLATKVDNELKAKAQNADNFKAAQQGAQPK